MCKHAVEINVKDVAVKQAPAAVITSINISDDRLTD